MDKVHVIDFFCGCGGTSSGLQKAGAEIMLGIDNNPIAIETYSNNICGAKTICDDIGNITFEQVEKVISEFNPKRLLFVACAPCQPFSMQNRLKKDSDQRITLLTKFSEFFEHFKPDYLILENVPGIQKFKDGPMLDFLDKLKKLGYKYDLSIKNALDYGVPQSRKRLVIIASKHSDISLPKATHGDGKLSYLTVKDTISKYPALRAGESSGKFLNHRCAGLQAITLNRLRHTKEGGDRRQWPQELMLNCHLSHSGHNDTYGRLSWNKPSVTLTTKCTSISNGRFGHPEQDRALSIREAAAIQTFDDDFKFFGNLQDMAKQVGNAVPVEFARVLGNQISHIIKR